MAVIALRFAGCGSGADDRSAFDGGRSNAPPYQGPLNAKDEPGAVERWPAARQAILCA